MQTGTSTPDNLIAGDFPRVTALLNIPSGNLSQGTVVTATGAIMASGGNPHAVLAEDANAAGGAVKAPVYLSGEFSRRHLILQGNAALSAADVNAMRLLNLYVKDTIAAP
jgi:hypothetical protein